MAAAGSDVPAEPFRLRSLALPVYLPTFLFAIGQGAVIPAIAQFATDLGATIALAAFIVGLRGIGTMLFDVPAGLLVGRFGERNGMALGALALVVVALGASFTGSPYVFAAFVFVMGCAWSVWLLVRLTYVSERAPVEVRGRALSLLGGTNRAGNFIGPILGGVLAVWAGLEYVFWLQAGFATLGSVLMFALVKDAAGPSVHDGSIYQRLSEVIVDHRRIFLTAGVVTICLQVLRNSRAAVFPLWGEQIGLDPVQIGVVFAVASSIDMVMFYPVGIVMDRLGRKWVGVPALAVMSLSMILVPAADTFVLLAGVALLNSLGNGMSSGIVMTLGADFSPAHRRGEFLGVWRLVGDIGTAGGPFVVGALASVLTLGAASVATGGIGLAGAALFFLTVPETLRRPTTAPRRPVDTRSP